MKAPTLLSLLLVLAACGHGGDGEDAKPHAALRERFYSGCARPGEFLTPESLPPIPPTFEEDVR
jgi:hypothetical protein